MNTSSVRQIKNWVFEHACKYGMVSVLKILFKDEKILEQLHLEAYEAEDSIPAVDAVVLFMEILVHFISSLKASVKNETEINLCWNKDILSLVLELLDTTYKQEHYISSKHYVHLITRLKLMALLRSVSEGQPSTSIVQNLNASFPRWNSDLRTNLQKQFRIKNHKVLDKLQESHAESRKFILRLTVSDAIRDAYLKQTFATDMQSFIDYAVLHLDQVLSAVRRKAGLSVIEKIFQAEDSCYVDDPAAQVILEYVQSSASESDFVNLLLAIDVGPDSPLNGGISAWLGNIDTLSDAGSDMGSQGVETDDENENEHKETDEAQVPNIFAGSTQPFELMSDFKNNLVESATIFEVTAESTMEVVVDSEEEEAS